MKKLLLEILLLLIYSHSYSQDLQVVFFKESADSNHLINDSTIIYPVFKFQNSAISKRINLVLKKDFKQFYDVPDSIENIQAILKEAASHGLVQLDYSLLRNDKRVFSFYLGNEGMGAYPSYRETYYCFDKTTGNLLTLDSLFSPVGKNAFLKVLRQKQKKNILKYKNEILKDFKSNGLRKEDYEFILSQIKNDCWENYNPSGFKIFFDKIEIIIDCEFPHYIQNMNPETSIFFSLISFKPYLKSKYKSL